MSVVTDPKLDLYWKALEKLYSNGKHYFYNYLDANSITVDKLKEENEKLRDKVKDATNLIQGK